MKYTCIACSVFTVLIVVAKLGAIQPAQAAAGKGTAKATSTTAVHAVSHTPASTTSKSAPKTKSVAQQLQDAKAAAKAYGQARKTQQNIKAELHQKVVENHINYAVNHSGAHDEIAQQNLTTHKARDGSLVTTDKKGNIRKKVQTWSDRTVTTIPSGPAGNYSQYIDGKNGQKAAVTYQKGKLVSKLEQYSDKAVNTTPTGQTITYKNGSSQSYVYKQGKLVLTSSRGQIPGLIAAHIQIQQPTLPGPTPGTSTQATIPIPGPGPSSNAGNLSTAEILNPKQPVAYRTGRVYDPNTGTSYNGTVAYNPKTGKTYGVVGRTRDTTEGAMTLATLPLSFIGGPTAIAERMMGGQIRVIGEQIAKSFAQESIPLERGIAQQILIPTATKTIRPALDNIAGAKGVPAAEGIADSQLPNVGKSAGAGTFNVNPQFGNTRLGMAYKGPNGQLVAEPLYSGNCQACVATFVNNKATGTLAHAAPYNPSIMPSKDYLFYRYALYKGQPAPTYYAGKGAQGFQEIMQRMVRGGNVGDTFVVSFRGVANHVVVAEKISSDTVRFFDPQINQVVKVLKVTELPRNPALFGDLYLTPVDSMATMEHDVP